MKFTDTQLTAYLLGLLPSAHMQQIDKQQASDHDLRERLRGMRTRLDQPFQFVRQLFPRTSPEHAVAATGYFGTGLTEDPTPTAAAASFMMKLGYDVHTAVFPARSSFWADFRNHGLRIVYGTPTVIRGATAHDLVAHQVELVFGQSNQSLRAFYVLSEDCALGVVDSGGYMSVHDAAAREQIVRSFTGIAPERPVETLTDVELLSRRRSSQRALYHMNLCLVGGPGALNLGADWWKDLGLPYSFTSEGIIYHGGKKDQLVPVIPLDSAGNGYDVAVLARRRHPRGKGTWVVVAAYAGMAGTAAAAALNHEPVMERIMNQRVTDGLLVKCPVRSNRADLSNWDNIHIGSQ